MKTTVFLIIYLFSFTFISASSLSREIRCDIYHAYIDGDMNKWERRLNHYLNADTYVFDDAALRTLLYARYGLIGYLLGNDQHEKAKNHLASAEEQLKNLMQAYPNDASLLALKGAFYGFKIDLNKSKVFVYGRKSMDYLDAAEKSNPDNPMVWVEKGNAKFHTPKIAGGSVDEAIRYYQKAISLFESSASGKQCNWLYLNSLVRLAKFYNENDQAPKALHVYNRLMEIEPDFMWVKNKLLPRQKNAMNITS